MGSLDALMGLRMYVYFINYVLRPFEWDSVSLDAFNSEISFIALWNGYWFSRDMGRTTEILNQDHCTFDGIFHFTFVFLR